MIDLTDFLFFYLACAAFNFALLSFAISSGRFKSGNGGEDALLAAAIVVIGPVASIALLVCLILWPLDKIFKKLFDGAKK